VQLLLHPCPSARPEVGSAKAEAPPLAKMQARFSQLTQASVQKEDTT
jgi:hypothetical protein